MGGCAEIAEDTVQADDAVLDHVLQEVAGSQYRPGTYLY
jgi:hypothetical protein